MNNETDQNLTETNTPITPAQSATAGAAAAPGPVSTEESNLLAAILGGLVAAVVGALIWAVITVITKYQIGFMAVGVGFLVAWAVRTLGKGRTNVYGIIGGGFALFGCLLGNLLSACEFIAADRSESVVSISMKVLASPSIATNLLQATFSGMDLLFYAIAIYEGYKFARR
jgi:hypothetical protein